ncbi:acyl-CoA thioesterase [Actinacidiphila glaucinigra]|uniref:acyl-CoA thioesterase n=1 Tax=Actinacidiphila glaucinigra TaxID=235986 RepID=UPI00366AEE9D
MNRVSEFAAGSPEAAPVTDFGLMIPVAVHFDDLDAYGVLHNSRYQVMVERAWSAFWSEQGFSVADRKDDAFHFVKQFEVIFSEPVTRSGTYAVHLWVERLGYTSMVAGYRLCSPNGASTKAYGTRSVVRIDPTSLQPIPWSDRARKIATTIMKPENV